MLAALAVVVVAVILLIVFRKPIYGNVCNGYKSWGMDMERPCCKHHVISTCYDSKGLINKMRNFSCNKLINLEEFNKTCKKPKKKK